MTARRQRGAALLAGALLALIFTTISAFQIAGWTVGAREHTTRQVVAGPISKVRIGTGAGDIVVLPSLDGRLHVDATARGALHSPDLDVVREGSAITLEGNCPKITFGPCQAQVRLQVPKDASVEVESGSGDITAEDLDGHAWLRTGSGDVTARGLGAGGELRTHSGEVTLQDGTGNFVLESRSGDVRGADLASQRVRAETASGDVDLLFRRAPSEVDAFTSSGMVHITLPKGEAYNVVTDTGSGDTEIGVRTDPGSPRIVRAGTESGNVAIGHAG